MKWGKKNRAAETKKNASFHSSKPSFQFSDVFSPFSWISRMKREKQSRLKANSPPANPKLFPNGTSDHHCFEDEPRRKSTGDDDFRRKIAFLKERPDISRSARHFSQSEIDFRPIPAHRRWELDSPPTTTKRADVRRQGKRMRSKVRVRSPRAARRAEEENDERTSLDSFAVVKRSRDPQKDFRESMMEMIREKGMRRPEEMENLLACYIYLNVDEHHDVIVKAFRQVLFDLKPRWLAGGRCHCCNCCDS